MFLAPSLCSSLPAPSLSSPNDGATTWAGVSLDWNAVVGSDYYEVQIDTTLLFNSSAFKNKIETYISSYSGNTDTQEFFDDLFFGTTYYWRVRAISAIDTSQWSTIHTLQTRSNVDLSSPNSNATTWTGVSLDWLSHHGVDYYEVQIDTTLLFNSSAFKNKVETYIGGYSGDTDTREFFDDLFFGTAYYWRVRAINAIDTSQWSTIHTLQTREKVGLINPLDSALNQPTTGIIFDWNAHQYVDVYELEWDTSNLFNSPGLQQHSENYTSSVNNNHDSQHSSGNLLVNQLYFWRIRAINAIDTSEWQSSVFSTGANIIIPDAPTLIMPLDGSIVPRDSIMLTWSNSTPTTSYIVQYSLNSSFSSNTTLTVYTPNTSLSNLSNNQLYYWRVRAVKGGVYSPWSSTWTFFTDNCQFTIIDTSITVAFDRLISNAINASFQWIDCNTGTNIPNATNSSYMPVNNGSYAVIINQNNCVDTSACYPFTLLYRNKQNHAREIKIYPNPVNSNLTIACTPISTTKILIRNSLGRILFQQDYRNITNANLNVEFLSSGIYFIEINGEGNTYIHKVIKL